MRRHATPVLAVLALLTCAAGAHAQAPAEPSLLRPPPALPRLPPMPPAKPTLSLGNYVDECARSGRPSADCLAGLATGSGIVALIGWAPSGGPLSPKELTAYRIYRVPAPGGVAAPRRPELGAGLRLGSGVKVSEGPFQGPLRAYALGMSRYEGGVLLLGVQRGQCFVAAVDGKVGGATTTAESEPACIDAEVRFGTETVLGQTTARQQRSSTRAACNRDAGKVLISPFDLRVGTQRYEGPCAGAWDYASLIDFDLRNVRFPLVRAELVQPAGAGCIGRLTLTNQNWEPDTGPVATGRPYLLPQTRDLTPGDALRQDVTAWLNDRGPSITGFQLSRGPSDGSTCLSSVQTLTLVLTKLR